MPVVQRPEFARVTLRAFDELSFLAATRVAHWPVSLCGFKRRASEYGYELVAGPVACAAAIIDVRALWTACHHRIHSILWITRFHPLHLLMQLAADIITPTPVLIGSLPLFD